VTRARTPFRRDAQARTAWLFTAPVLAIILFVFVLPTVLALALSVTDYSIYALADWRNLSFVGLGNFIDLLRTPLFWRALGNTALFAVLGVPMAIGASLGAALLLNERTVRWKPLWRVLLFAPYVTSVVATAVVWRFLLNTRYGLINWAIGLVGIPPVDWLGDPHVSIPAILLFVTWKVFGYNMIVFTAALAAVPNDLMEAARLDGAGRWTRFRHVTLPAIGPTLLLAAVMSVAGFLQIFAEPYVMTLGGPAQSTVTVLYFMFDEGFKWWNLGQASAVAFILFLLILALTAVQTRVGRRYEWL
jgi:multiple sugar transport system permease protein